MTQYSTVQYGTVQYGTVWYSTVRYSTVRYSMVQYNTVQYGTVQYGTAWYSTILYSTVWYSTVRYSTVRYSTVRYSMVQYSTVQGCPNVWKKSKCLVKHTDKSLNVWAYIGTFKQILGGFCLERGYFVWRWGVLSPLPSYHSYEPIIWYKILWNSVKIGKMGLFSGPFPLELVY